MPSSPRPGDSGALLFVYGSLLLPTGVAAVDRALARWCRPLGPAFIHGRLYSLGAYPGVKPVRSPAYVAGPGTPAPLRPHRAARIPIVKGRLLRLVDPKKALAALDSYEDFDPGAPERSEFVREEVWVVRPGNKTPALAQTYFYNRAVRGKRPIASGDYLEWRLGRAEAADRQALRARGEAK